MLLARKRLAATDCNCMQVPAQTITLAPQAPTPLAYITAWLGASTQDHGQEDPAGWYIISQPS